MLHVALRTPPDPLRWGWEVIRTADGIKCFDLGWDFGASGSLVYRDLWTWGAGTSKQLTLTSPECFEDFENLSDCFRPGVWVQHTSHLNNLLQKSTSVPSCSVGSWGLGRAESFVWLRLSVEGVIYCCRATYYRIRHTLQCKANKASPSWLPKSEVSQEINGGFSQRAGTAKTHRNEISFHLDLVHCRPTYAQPRGLLVAGANDQEQTSPHSRG